MEQMRTVGWFAQAMIDAGLVKRYDKARPLEDGTGEAIGIWKMEGLLQMPDLQVEIVVCERGEL